VISLATRQHLFSDSRSHDPDQPFYRLDWRCIEL
jgi:hypothetical protein